MNKQKLIKQKHDDQCTKFCTGKCDCYVENEHTLAEYFLTHEAEGILQDNLSDAFDSWVAELSEEDIKKMI